MSTDTFQAFTWNSKYCTGIAEIDEQHHALVDFINRLGAISMRQADPGELDAILGELGSYTVYHFATEERLMHQFAVGQAHRAAHGKAHQHFTDQLGVAVNILLNGQSGQVVNMLLDYLTRWLTQHILGLDTRMASEILALEAGASHEDAERHANAFMSQSANVLLEALNEMYGKLGDKNLELMQLNLKLASKHEALLRMNEELEQRVNARTSALAESNQRLLESNVELTRLNSKLETARHQLLQSEKLAAIGQLAAGVAHEINNPIGFVNANLGTLNQYLADLLLLLAAYEQAESGLAPAEQKAIEDVRSRIELDYLRADVPNLMKESLDGLDRVKRITQDLKDFSHVDESTWQLANIEKGMDSTLNVVWNEVKQKADVVKDYGGIPEVECMPSQLNQVFMNLLVNAAQAIAGRGVITLRSGLTGSEAWMEVSDTGTGILQEHLDHVFDPFFTTKPVGKGTGLGLSLSYGIVQKHGGRIEVASTPGKGTAMRVWLPVRQASAS